MLFLDQEPGWVAIFQAALFLSFFFFFRYDQCCCYPALLLAFFVRSIAAVICYVRMHKRSLTTLVDVRSRFYKVFGLGRFV